MTPATDIPIPAFGEAVRSLAASPMFIAGLVLALFVLLRLRRQRPDWAALASRMTSRSWSSAEVRTVALTPIPLLLAAWLLIARLEGLQLVDPTRMLLIQVTAQGLVFHLPILLLILAMARRQGRSSVSAFGWDPRRLWTDARAGVVAYLAAMPAIVMVAILTNHLLTLAGWPPGHQRVVELLAETHSRAVDAGLIVMAIVVAPTVEELLFRGVLLPHAARRLGTLPAILVVSLAFAAIHLHARSLAPLFAMAVAFSAAYLYSGSIAVPIVMHTLFNSASILVILTMKHAPAWSLTQ